MQMYIIDDSLEFNRKEFEEFLIETIVENEMYNLIYLLGDGKASVERHVRHHPFKLAKEIFGDDRVVTYEKIGNKITGGRF